MSIESYTPGYTPNAVVFMMKRSLESRGQFFLPCLAPDLSVLDRGYGAGTIHEHRRPLSGNVAGESPASQMDRAIERRRESIANVE